MAKPLNASRVVGLLVVLMAAIVVLSGPVAGVLELPEPTTEAKKKHKKKHKKKKKNRPPAFNVVQCPGGGNTCEGTAFNDFLVGTDGSDFIVGRAGNDVYQGNGGDDTLFDGFDGNDAYLFPATAFASVFLRDNGGGGDGVVLSSHDIDDFDASNDGAQNLILDGPGESDIKIDNFFTEESKIEFFLFREGYFTGDQVASRIE